MEEKIKALDVYDKEFQLIFYTVVKKFVEEYNDMSQMGAIQKAQALLEELNN